jgi:hypothetical protein
MSRVNVYADILAFTDQPIIIAPNSSGTILVASKVLIAAVPITITVPRNLTTSCVISIYASVLD